MNVNDSGAEEAASGAPGAATGLFRSLTGLVATLVSIASTRLELLTTELQEEVQRASSLVIWALITLLMATIGLFLGGLTIVFVYWDTHRVLAALLVTSGFFILTIGAVMVLIVKINARPRFLDATLTELTKDSLALKNRVESPK